TIPVADGASEGGETQGERSRRRRRGRGGRDRDESRAGEVSNDVVSGDVPMAAEREATVETAAATDGLEAAPASVEGAERDSSRRRGRGRDRQRRERREDGAPADSAGVCGEASVQADAEPAP